MTTPPLGPSGSPSPNDLPFGGRVGDQLRSQEGPGGGSGSITRLPPSEPASGASVTSERPAQPRPPARRADNQQA